MTRRSSFAVAAVLYSVGFTALCGILANAFDIIALSGRVKILSGGLAVLSCSVATYFGALATEKEKRQKFVKGYLFFLFAFYLIMLVDFTLIDDTFGRNIFNVSRLDTAALKLYFEQSTNFVPFATIELFIKGYINGRLSLPSVTVNLLGNFTAFMPLVFFVSVFFKRYRGFLKMLLCVLFSVLVIELLQLVCLTGACDIDDVILNTGGAMLFYYLCCATSFGRGVSKLTFGVWGNEYKKA